jgi:glycosyltransferase involved in cell wall biosynthesis
MPPSLSIVIPYHEEPASIGSVVEALQVAAARSPFEEIELVVVDDGSSPEAARALETLSWEGPVSVLRQENKGRFAARRTGVEAARGELVLLIDSRVWLRPDALAFVAERLDGADTRVWNAHVEIDLAGNPYARFWNVLTELAFATYFDAPRTTSFGLEDFDRFPKGTTCFLCPRELLLEAMDAFDSFYEDVRHANDDTIVIRHIAGRARINISPGFSCLYRSRTELRPFLRHAFHRGGVFVDGYLRPGTRFFAPLLAFLGLSPVAVALATRHRGLALSAALGVPVAAAALPVARRRPLADAAAMGALAPAWALAYGLGIWRGVLRALSARLR